MINDRYIEGLRELGTLVETAKTEYRERRLRRREYNHIIGLHSRLEEEKDIGAIIVGRVLEDLRREAESEYYSQKSDVKELITSSVKLISSLYKERVRRNRNL